MAGQESMLEVTAASFTAAIAACDAGSGIVMGLLLLDVRVINSRLKAGIMQFESCS